MAESIEKIKFQVEVPGAAEAAREFDRVSTTLGKTAAQANDNARKFDGLTKSLDSTKAASEALRVSADKQGDAFGKLSQNASRGAQVLTAFTASLGSAVPGLNEVASAIGRTSGAMGAMSGILGGAAGLATGGILLAVGLFAKKLYGVREETKNLAKATIDYNTTLAEQLALLEKSGKTAAYRQQLGLGVLSADQTLAEARVKEARQTEVRLLLSTAARNEAGGLLDAAKFERLTKEYWQLDSELKKLRSDITRIKAEDAAFNAEDAQAELDELRGKGDRLSTKYQAKELKREKPKDIAELESEVSGRTQAVSESLKIAEQATGEFDAKFEAAEKKKQQAAKETARELKRLDEERAKREQVFTDASLEHGQLVLGAGLSIAQQLAKGQEISVKDIVAGIGDQMVALGTKHLFEGLAMSANPLTPGLGAGLIGVATAEIAAGLALGAASAAGGSGKSGAAAAPAKLYYTQGADGSYVQSAIEPAARPGTTSGGAQIVNVNMPTVVAASASDWKRIEAARNEARRQGV